VQAVLHVHELGDLGLQQARDRDARPPRDDLGDLVGVDDVLEVDGRRLERVARVGLGQPPLELGDLAVAQLRGALVVELALRAVELGPRGGQPLGDLRGALELLLLALPLGAHAGEPLLGLGELALELLAAVDGGVVLLHRDVLDLELGDPPRDLVDLRRDGRELDRDARGRLVDEVDGLVGQEAVGDVAVAEGRRGDQRRVGDPDVVVGLVALLEARAGSRSCPPRTARRPRRAGSAARARRPSRRASCTRRASSRRSRAARRGPASA
jgi:hypothetical protein